MKKIIDFLIGIPYSGKSTWTLENKEKYNSFVVSADKVRELMYGEKTYKIGAEPMVWATRHYLLRSALEQDFDIIIDETNTTKYRRKETLKILRKHDCTIIAHYFDTPLEICKERLEAVFNNLAEIDPAREDIASMYPAMLYKYQKMEAPELAEGFDEIVNHAYMQKI